MKNQLMTTIMKLMRTQCCNLLVFRTMYVTPYMYLKLYLFLQKCCMLILASSYNMFPLRAGRSEPNSHSPDPVKQQSHNSSSYME